MYYIRQNPTAIDSNLKQQLIILGKQQTLTTYVYTKKKPKTFKTFTLLKRLQLHRDG